MELSRREFLKFGGTGIGALVLLKGAGSIGSKAAASRAILLEKHPATRRNNRVKDYY
jgi:hypothetical protein